MAIRQWFLLSVSYLFYVNKTIQYLLLTDVSVSFSYLSFLCLDANSFILSQSAAGSSTLGI
jgi:hypothetical protein